eukprot:CAMPEP_0172191158 /NCGR_PEP_ID=MMETSP1050-20130122/23538_1 /TAXON_ID=233186 /ORGANISM="Cryptomonas curvata, Strain CCAP979/52" /LENGTH=136 /DNA_ID=CAMNT_0012866161 /DNA_START=193 /DNA_END=600 /DNA_ORIENTATION=+
MCRKSETSKTTLVKVPEPSKQAPQAGIGAVFTIDQANRIIFCASASGSSSHDAIERGLLERGDVLVAIDGVGMENRSMHDVAARLLGAPGSLVMVRFRRQVNNVYVENTIAMDRRPMKVTDIRKVAESVSIATPRS